MIEQITIDNGYIIYEFYPNLLSINILELFVDSEFRGQKIGTKLLNEVKKRFPNCKINLIADDTFEEYENEADRLELTEKENNLLADFYYEYLEQPTYLTKETYDKIKELVERSNKIKELRNIRFKLHKFYRDNYFVNEYANYFVSYPPHKLRPGD